MIYFLKNLQNYMTLIISAISYCMQYYYSTSDKRFKTHQNTRWNPWKMKIVLRYRYRWPLRSSPLWHNLSCTIIFRSRRDTFIAGRMFTSEQIYFTFPHFTGFLVTSISCNARWTASHYDDKAHFSTIYLRSLFRDAYSKMIYAIYLRF